MPLGKYFSNSRVINLKSDTFEGAIKELVATFPGSLHLNRKELAESFIQKEHSISTYLDNGIAIPHIRTRIKKPCILAIGRTPDGLIFENAPEYEHIRLVLLILLNDEDDSYLQILAMLARILHDAQIVYQLTHTSSLQKLKLVLKQLFLQPKPEITQEHTSAKSYRLFLREAFRMATEAGCSTVFIFADTFTKWFDFGSYFGGLNTILVTEKIPEEIRDDHHVDAILSISSPSSTRLAQMRSALLLALSRHLIRSNEKVCCIGGLKNSNRMDALVLIDIAEEYQSIFKSRRGLIPKSVRPEVFERAIAIANEIAIEGREGKPVGTMFVLGNNEKLRAHYRSLILNPFMGYPRQERNILNPFMDETIKEFASLDGAFIIDGDGVLEAAGVMVNSPDKGTSLPSGLGTRHTSAAALSKAFDCAVIVISESTSQVTLFRNGQMLPLTEKVIA